MSTPGQSTLQPFLDRLLGHSALSEAEQRDILALPTHVHQVSANRDFVPLAQYPNHCSMVVTGLMGRFDQNRDVERQITALHIAGDMPDLWSLVQPESACALQALTTTTLVAVPHNALRAIGAKHAGVMEALWRDCMADSRILTQWLVNVGRRSARARLAHLMCEMACRYKVAPSDSPIRFSLRMTQQHLADAMGLTSVHVNRTLQSLKADGLVVRHGTVWIDNWERLAEIGEFDADYLSADVAQKPLLRLVN